MHTSILIDDKLIRAAMRATGLATKREVVEEGLKVLIQIKGQKRLRSLRGKIKWEGDLTQTRASRV